MNKKPIRAKENFLVFGQPQINEIEIQDVVETLRSGWIGTGPKVQQFEKQFSTYKKVNGAVALNSCTSATHLSLLISKIQKGDEIITTPGLSGVYIGPGVVIISSNLSKASLVSIIANLRISVLACLG